MIYLDSAATSYHKPDCVAEAVYHAIKHLGNSGRGFSRESLEASRVIFDTRCMLAELFETEGPRQVAFTSNATEALNTAILGSFQAKGKIHVITTAMEHNSVLRPLYLLEDGGMELTILRTDEKGCISPEEMEGAVKANTRAIVCTHASNLTGNLNNIREIGRIAKAHRLLFILDASQTAGVFPVSMEKDGIDILCCSGHKGLMGPQGTGVICVRPGISLNPLKTGGSGVQTFSRTHPVQMPEALEAGTLNGHGIAGLGAALKWLKDTGIDKVRLREQSLMIRFHKQVKDIPGVRIYGDFSDYERAPVVTLNIKDYDSYEIGSVLMDEFEISTRAGGHCAPLMHEALGTREQGAVRFSFSYFNTEEEIDRAAEAVRKTAQEA
ncbi:MAG: aminotransferase class V-fold PLP-dependent enzyme [Eubacteriales bacterium]|nr:aminotransferase class V-fold PLP-dependent enzyme [Eubacteriales bacterium]